MHTRDWKGKDNNNSYKSKKISCSFKVKRRSKKCYILIAAMDFEECLRKSDVSENGKSYYSRFLQNGPRERHCYISKSRWNV